MTTNPRNRLYHPGRTTPNSRSPVTTRIQKSGLVSSGSRAVMRCIRYPPPVWHRRSGVRGMLTYNWPIPRDAVEVKSLTQSTFYQGRIPGPDNSRRPRPPLPSVGPGCFCAMDSSPQASRSISALMSRKFSAENFKVTTWPMPASSEWTDVGRTFRANAGLSPKPAAVPACRPCLARKQGLCPHKHFCEGPSGLSY
jgi:hypothetical protein